MELEKVKCSSSDVVLLIYDPDDGNTCELIRDKLTDNNILCYGLSDTPGEQMLQVYRNLAPVVKKAVFLFSHSSARNKGLHISAAGFFYAGFGETGRWFYCGCVLTNIRQKGLPLATHAARYPTCRYVRSNLTDDEITEVIADFKVTDKKSKIAEAVKEKFQDLDTE
ncbi:unnamed protein product [Mytilus edulis]|uniref:Uncharacterized protein n=1 Tax=Mytilus edulis TaxID=6550 RepID=A0A8S3QW79_MYTED|nr:unnamed protein product [Mytilus edulis]